MPRGPHHYAYIDTLRGLAFLLVLALHACLCVGSFRGSVIIENMGDLGVPLFFLASAITLCNSMEARQKVESHPLAFFYLRRFFRIAPLYWLAIVVYNLFPGILYTWMGGPAAAGARPTGPVPIDYICNFLFVHGWYPYAFNSIVPGGWSIGVEMAFYAIFPLLYYLTRSLRRAAVGFLISTAICRILLHYKAYMADHWYGNLPEVLRWFYLGNWLPMEQMVFVTGILTYYLLRHPSVITVLRDRLGAMVLFLVSLGALPTLLSPHGITQILPLFTLTVMALAGVVLSISQNQVPFIVNRFFGYVGKVSYSCYITHFAVLASVRQWLHLDKHAWGSSTTNFKYFVVYYSLVLLLTLPLSTLTHYLVENPGIYAGKQLIRYLNRSRS